MEVTIKHHGWQLHSGKEIGIFSARLTGPGGYISDYFVIADNHDEAFKIINDGKAVIKMRSRVGDAIFGKYKPNWEGD
tara:strand:- start:1497 stop:1730 length:234 start_codon:yes stop_codon:yes gene_type:complete